jgi:hypothetical protein
MPYKDIDKQKLSQHESYLRRKDLYHIRHAKRKKARSEWYKEFMEDKQCVICKETASEVLDWHHVNPTNKKGQIASMVKKNRPFSLIFEELEKCICVCANCHRKIHAGTVKVAGTGFEPVL